MMTAQDDNTLSSPSLVEVAVGVRSEFQRNIRKQLHAERVIVKADDVARIYFQHNEKLTANELDVLYEVLREFGIVAAHIPADFHVHVANVIKCLERGDKTITKSHVAGLIFSRM